MPKQPAGSISSSIAGWAATARGGAAPRMTRRSTISRSADTRDRLLGETRAARQFGPEIGALAMDRLRITRRLWLAASSAFDPARSCSATIVTMADGAVPRDWPWSTPFFLP